MELKDLKQIDQRMNEGVWVQLEPNVVDRETDQVTKPGARIRIRHGLSVKYQDALKEADKDLRRLNGYRDDKDLTGDEIVEVRRQAIARGAIVDWEHFTDDGQPVSYTVENALRFLAVPTFFLRLWGLIQEETNYYAENLEAKSGN